jgi:hypothetical protein
MQKVIAKVITSQPLMQIEIWSIDRLIFYARNPRKNDAAVDHVAGWTAH